MSAVRLAIDRITVTLLGASVSEAEDAGRSLEAALLERLGGWRPRNGAEAGSDQANMDLGEVRLARRLDGRALAALIADRLVTRLDEAAQAPQEQPL